MQCTAPVEAWVSRAKSEKTGRHLPTWRVQEAMIGRPIMEVNCGKCFNCRAGQKLAWTMRAMFENSLHEQSCFITPTFSEENLERVFSGCKTDEEIKFALWKEHDLYLKRLRRQLPAGALRYLVVGELGDRTKRPHLHYLLFGRDFREHCFHGDVLDAGGSSRLMDYQSPLLNERWGNGSVFCGTVTVKSAAYVAGYCLKKSAGESGFVFKSQSNGYAIGRGWGDKYVDDIRRLGHCVIDGKKMPVPKQFFDWFPEELEGVRNTQFEFAQEQAKLPKVERLRRAQAKEAFSRKCREIFASGRGV